MPKLIVVIVTNMQVCHDVIHLWEEAGRARRDDPGQHGHAPSQRAARPSR